MTPHTITALLDVLAIVGINALVIPVLGVFYWLGRPKKAGKTDEKAA
jgi:hypothetical protein